MVPDSAVRQYTGLPRLYKRICEISPLADSGKGATLPIAAVMIFENTKEGYSFWHAVSNWDMTTAREKRPEYFRPRDRVIRELKPYPELYRTALFYAEERAGKKLASSNVVYKPLLSAFDWTTTRESFAFWGLVAEGEMEKAKQLEPQLFALDIPPEEKEIGLDPRSIGKGLQDLMNASEPGKIHSGTDTHPAYQERIGTEEMFRVSKEQIMGTCPSPSTPGTFGEYLKKYASNAGKTPPQIKSTPPDHEILESDGKLMAVAPQDREKYLPEEEEEETNRKKKEDLELSERIFSRRFRP